MNESPIRTLDPVPAPLTGTISSGVTLLVLGPKGLISVGRYLPLQRGRKSILRIHRAGKFCDSSDRRFNARKASCRAATLLRKP